MHTTIENHPAATTIDQSPAEKERLRREAYAEVVLGEDAPTSADCATCGASHVFDTLAIAEEWQGDHGDLGHRVEITTI
jgi:hypothetical protein